MNLHTINAAFASTDEIKDSEFLSELCTSILAIYPGGVPQMPWAGYLAKEDDEFVGTCAFKSAPVDGRVEIAYFTFPEHEGRGTATRMAKELLSIAKLHKIFGVMAQTLPQENASTSILRKLGFRFVGVVNHPDDGKVWEWQLG